MRLYKKRFGASASTSLMSEETYVIGLDLGSPSISATIVCKILAFVCWLPYIISKVRLAD